MEKKKSRPAPLSWQSSLSSNVTTSSSSQKTEETLLEEGHQSPREPRSPRGTSPRGSPTVRSPTARSPTRNSNLGYLASRRGSLGQSTVAKEESESPKYKPRRRQSNFLELPVAVDHFSSGTGHNTARSPTSPRQHRVSSLPVNNLLYNPRSVSPSRLLARQRTTAAAATKEARHHRHGNYENIEDELYRLRSFNIKNNTVVNCGDSFIPVGQSRNPSGNSSRTSLQGTTPATPTNVEYGRSLTRSPLEGSCCSPSYYGSSTSLNSEDDLGAMEQRYRVVLLGHTSVGKSALVSQFMTSDYINTYDVSLDDEFGERLVSVLLDGVESELNFVDHPCSEMSAENSLSTYDPHGCIVVYSVTDRHSFDVAADILRYLWQEGITHDKAVILVANKCDLERAREVNVQEGKSLASSHSCKFIETSSGIQHNVDELLVGILKQCRLRDSRQPRHRGNNIYGSRTSITIHLAREIIGKLCFKNYNKKSKSCQNLHVL